MYNSRSCCLRSLCCFAHFFSYLILCCFWHFDGFFLFGVLSCFTRLGFRAFFVSLLSDLRLATLFFLFRLRWRLFHCCFCWGRFNLSRFFYWCCFGCCFHNWFLSSLFGF